MIVLDTSFLIDYGSGDPGARAYLESNEAASFLLPTPVYLEYLLGTVHTTSPTDIAGAKRELAWAEVVDVDERTAEYGAEVADAVGPEGPLLTGVDALVAGVARQYDARVVSGDGDLTHPEVRDVIDVEEY